MWIMFIIYFVKDTSIIIIIYKLVSIKSDRRVTRMIDDKLSIKIVLHRGNKFRWK